MPIPKTDRFTVTRKSYTTTPPPPSIECKPGPLGQTNIKTLYLVQLSAGQATYGSINKGAPSATILLSYTEFQNVLNAVAQATPTHPVDLLVTYTDLVGNAQLADVSSVVPAQHLAQHTLLAKVDADLTTVSATTTAIAQRTQELAVELGHLKELARFGFVKLGVSESELPLAGLDASPASEYPSEPPTADSDAPPAFPQNGSSLENRPLGH